MIEKLVNITGTKHLTRDQALRVVQAACAFESHILFKCENSIINAKSLLGVLSMNIITGEPLLLSCDGNDELEAEDALLHCIASF
jgi:phosphotransferase system HPr (HPr) family protein